MAWIFLKIILMILPPLANLPICYKILSKSSLHNIFNVSFACFFALEALIGPVSTYYFFEAFQLWAIGGSDEDRRWACGRLVHATGISLVFTQVIDKNLFFR